MEVAITSNYSIDSLM